MPASDSAISLQSFQTFGDFLKYLRARARLTQRELSIAVGYSEAQISRLEQNHRPPELASLLAQFIPALYIEDEPETITRLMELAAQARGESLPSSGQITFSRSVQREITETIEVLEPSQKHNLPVQLTSFIGREDEIAEVKRLLRQARGVQEGIKRSLIPRLVTLTGAGGSGKTRLALQVAVELFDAFPDGVWFVDFAPLNDPALLVQTVGNVLNVRQSQHQSLEIALNHYVRDKTLLLILDNCEHLIESCAQLAETILGAGPMVSILATSRETLNIPGEYIYPVPLLSTPHPDNMPPSEALPRYEAVRLFIERASAALPSFALTDGNAPAVVQICHHLDGIPLALELAAARVKLMQVEEIAARLEDRFRLLSGGSRTALPRHQTLHGLIDWSYDLLSEKEGALLRQLAVFSGSCTLEAAEAIYKDEATLDLLSQLVNKSLILVEQQPGIETRYRLLETIREYAREKLVEAGEVVRARERHFDFFCTLAQRIGTEVFGPEKAIWLDRVEADLDNFRAALICSLEADPAGALPPLADRAERAILLVVSLLDFYWCRGYMVEAREWLDRLLAVDMPPSRIRAWGFQKAGWFNRASGDFEKASMLLDQALSMSREIGDKYRAGMSLADLGMVARDHQDDSARAIDYFSEALSLFQAVGDNQGIGCSFYYLAQVKMLNGKLDKARQLWQEGLDLFRREGDKSHIAWGLQGIGDVAFLDGELGQATEIYRESLKYLSEVMDQPAIAFLFEALAQVAAAEKRSERASILWGASDKLRQTLEMLLEPAFQRFYRTLIPTVRTQLGEQAFEAAWAKGRGMTLAQAIEYALASSDQ
jgi:predicted ATPase/transcriptional regulator with XRE-family HTH domain